MLSPCNLPGPAAQVLRGNKDSVIAMLEAFVHDPLINWRLLNTAETGTEAAAVDAQLNSMQACTFGAPPLRITERARHAALATRLPCEYRDPERHQTLNQQHFTCSVQDCKLCRLTA